MTIDPRHPHRIPVGWRLAAAAGIAVLTACNTAPGKDEVEAAKNTVACQLAGERIVIRFDTGEARLLMPGGDRVTLYQISAASGVRYTNGLMELRGKGMELQLVRDGSAATLEGCAQYAPPKP